MNIKKDILRRATVASIAISLFAVAIISQLVYIQFFARYDGKMWKEHIPAYHIRKDTLPATRGNIFSSNGSFLATSLPYYYVGIDPRVAKEDYFNQKIDSLGLLLSRRFGGARQEYIDLIRSARKKQRKYILLSRKVVTFQDRLVMLSWPFFRRGHRSEGGGKFDAIYRRYHPFGRMALRTVGYLNPETNRGLVGLEASYQKELAGKNGVGLVEELSGGVKMPVEDGSDIKPEPGLDVYTTIDVNFQDMAETALLHALEKYQADKGCVVVMEVQTGEIRAMANLTHYKGKYVETFNHALAGRTDPGSTFKLASMMALLEEKAVRPDQLVETGGGALRYRGVAIHDAKRGGYGRITAQQVFEKSSNIGIHLLMRNYFYSRPELYCRYLHQFKLDRPTGFQMRGEAVPVVRNPQSRGWSNLSLTFMSVGYEMQLTPLQMLTFYNAVANDGKWVRPMIVRQNRRADEVIKDFQPYVAPEPICSQETIRKVKAMLEGVVDHGTAKNIKSSHYKIAGKTGTAQKLVNGQYRVGKYFTSFIGYFPADKPKYSCIVVVDSPKGDNVDLLYAGSVSAPVFKEVADRIFAYDVSMHSPVAIASSKSQRSRLRFLASGSRAGFADDLRTITTELRIDGQPAIDGWVKAEGKGTKVRWVGQTARDEVPDLRGMTLRDALHLLENRGFRVRFQGVGKVVGQSLEPGSRLPLNRGITITLRQPVRSDSLQTQSLITKRA